jgi:hypothetical protein
LAALGAPKDPLHRNEVLVGQEDWDVKHHAAVLLWLTLASPLKDYSHGFATHGAVLLVVKQHVASGP